MQYREAELSLENREEKIEELVDVIESNLVLLGATGKYLELPWSAIDNTFCEPFLLFWRWSLVVGAIDNLHAFNWLIRCAENFRTTVFFQYSAM